MTGTPTIPLPSAWTAAYNPVALVNVTVGSSTLLGFQTFCLELNESVSMNVNYHAYLGGAAIQGGVGGGSPDPISIGTAWLYKEFATGKLTGYDYTPGPGREVSARALQEAIWYLEDELTSIGPNPFITLVVNQFGSVAAAKANYAQSGANFNVRVVNPFGIRPTGATNFDAPRQSYLVYLPDGGMTLVLLGTGLLGLAIVRRRG